jgi:hypothetical protein
MCGSERGLPQGIAVYSQVFCGMAVRETQGVYSRPFSAEVFTPVDTNRNLPAAPAFEVFMLNATVSGSFHRHMGAITTAVHELAALSVRVLSPADPRIVAEQGEFLFVASDPVRSVRLVQDRHLECIRAANFLWLVCPDGYIGQSASMEIGYAVREGVPIFSTHAPSDLTLRQYVRVVPSLVAAIKMISLDRRRGPIPGFLIDPKASVEQAHYILDRIGTILTGSDRSEDDPASRVYRDMSELNAKLGLPSYMQ